MKFVIEIPDNGGDLLKDHTPDELACAIRRQIEKLEFDNGDILHTHGVIVSSKSDFGLDLEALEDLARHYTGFSGEVEIDTLEPGDVSPGNDGIWVRAWVHLPNDSLDAAGIENPEAVRDEDEE